MTYRRSNGRDERAGLARSRDPDAVDALGFGQRPQLGLLLPSQRHRGRDAARPALEVRDGHVTARLVLVGAETVFDRERQAPNHGGLVAVVITVALVKKI